MAEPELVFALLSESVQALHPLPVTAEIRRLGTKSSVLVSFGGKGSPTPCPGVPDTGSP